MEKVMTLVRRPAGAERAAFLETLIKGARSVALARLPQLAALTIDLVDIPAEEAGLRPGGEPSFDAVVEIWLDVAPGEVSVALIAPALAALDPGATQHAYHVTERIKRDFERTWPVGERSPGVKSIYLARRHPDMTREQYSAHWDTTHAPLALKHHVGMWRYLQDVVIEALTPDAPPWDGFAELHFRTAQDLRERFYDSDEGRAVIAADVARFSSGGRVLHTSEYVLRA